MYITDICTCNSTPFIELKRYGCRVYALGKDEPGISTNRIDGALYPGKRSKIKQNRNHQKKTKFFFYHLVQMLL